MAITIVCPGCKKSFSVDDKFAGKSGPCPKCKTKLTIPEKMPEVKIHAPDEFAGGGKSVTGKLLLKPIARKEVRITPALGAIIGGAVVAAIAWALVVRHIGGAAESPLRHYLSAAGLLLISPVLAIAAYAFLRDDELEPYRGMQLYIRAGASGLTYTILWGVFIYVKLQMAETLTPPMWFVVLPPFFVVGGLAGKLALDLDATNGFFHYAFYAAVTMLLGLIAGLGLPWR
jgi:hypothetical protein